MRRKKKPAKSSRPAQPPSAAEAPAAPEAAPVSTSLTHIQVRLAGVRRSYRRATLETAACAALATLAAWLTLECSLDYLTMLRWGFRACFLFLALAAVGFLTWWLAVRPLRSSLHDDAIALMIERALPVFRTRFIATIQLLRSERAAQALVRALAAETSTLASTQRFNTVVDRRKLRAWTKAFAITLLVALSLGLLGAEKTAPLLRRAFLSTEPVPRRTKIDVTPAPRVLAVGDDFLIEARVGGEIPTRGRIFIEPARGPKHELPFEPLGTDRARFSRQLRSVQETFSFTVALGDARTEPVRIKVKPRPAVVTIDAQQVYPAYTGLKPERRSLTALKLLAGSRLAIRAKANTKLSSAGIRLLAPSQEDNAKQTIVAETPLKLEGWGRTEGAGEIAIPAANVTGLAIRLVDDDGVESRSNTVYRIERILDAPPTLKLILPPRREEFITAGATMLVAFDARDDFGIARARLHYAVDWQEGAPHKTIELDVPPSHPRELLRRFQWQIPKLQPPPVEGQVIDYWLEIADANDVTGPGVTVLEHHQASVVTELEKRAELASRLSDAMQGLNTTRDAQERLNETLGEFIFEKPPDAP